LFTPSEHARGEKKTSAKDNVCCLDKLTALAKLLWQLPWPRPSRLCASDAGDFFAGVSVRVCWFKNRFPKMIYQITTSPTYTLGGLSWLLLVGGVGSRLESACFLGCRLMGGGAADAF